MLVRSVRRSPTLALRLAAGLVGFVGVAGAMACLERKTSPPAEPEPWVESLTPISRSPDASALFASVPEYQLLVGIPRSEDGR